MAKYMASELADCKNRVQAGKRGQWIPARPVNYRFDSWRWRLKQAWRVFTGRYDCVDWGDQ